MKIIFFLLAVLFSIKVTSAQESSVNNYRIEQNYGITKFTSNNEIIIPPKNETFKTSPKAISIYKGESQSLNRADTVNNPTIEKPDTSIRSNYFYMSFGIMDIMGVGLGWQINSNFAIGLKWTGYWLSGGTFVPNSGTGIGIKISEKITFGIFNNINYETTFFYRYSDQKPEKSKVLIKGFAVDINIGDENINDNGFNFIWLVGVVVSSAQGSKPLLLPNLKIGFNINF